MFGEPEETSCQSLIERLVDIAATKEKKKDGRPVFGPYPLIGPTRPPLLGRYA